MANTKTLSTDLSTTPYGDDFDPEKNYVRILFKPSLAVQARELTQIQSTLQKQVGYTAEHLFEEGAIVRNGKINVDFDLKYVKVKDEDVFGNPLNVSELMGKEILSSTTDVSAVVLNYADGSEASDPDTKMLFIKYQSASSANGTLHTFVQDETLISNTGVQFSVIDSNTAIGDSSSVTITDGVLFAKGHLIYFPSQTAILDKFKSNPTCRVGFELIETIVTADEDSTLLDPASGTTNYAAPGADRLKITPVLTVYDDPADITEDFVEILNIQDGVIQSKKSKTEYSVIADEFARRTSDESGNYFVRGLGVHMREHLNDGSNFGLLTSEEGGNSSLLAVGVEPGKAYVFGYEVEKLVTQYVETDKAIDVKHVESQNIAANYGNYVLVKEFVGSPNLNSGVQVKLYDTAQQRITNNEYSTPSPSGSEIGTAILKSVEYDSGVPGTPEGKFRVYLSNIQMTGGNFSEVKAIYRNNTSTADLVMDIVGDAYLREKAFSSHVYPIPTSFTKSLRDENDEVETSFLFKKTFDVSIAEPGTFSINTGASDEIFPYGAGALNSSQKRTNFLMTINTAATVSMSGTISGTEGTKNITGAGTDFTKLNVGDKITAAGQTLFVESITSATSMKVTENLGSTLSSETFVKTYAVGDIIDLSSKGASGTERSITIDTSTSASFDLKETLSNTISATICTNLSKVNAREIKKVIKRNRLVQINTATHTNGEAGPWSLGFSDVFRINSVRIKSSDFTGPNEGTDVTNKFQLDDGQRDDIYDHSMLKPKFGYTVPNNYRILVNLDYFQHDTSQGVGFLSVDSYPIDDVNGAANTSAITTSEIPIYTSPTTGITYDLRDCIDTRNAKVATATDTTEVGAMTTNPATTTSLVSPVSGIHTPTPNESFLIDYSYYLPRKDLLTMSRKGVIRIVRGVPSLNPATPDLPADSMALAELHIAPYPSLPPSLSIKTKRPNYANKVRNVAIRRYTMAQIGLLEKRIENLEYYTALNFLEKATMDLKILDDNGLDRFKNGILVDPFNDHSIGDVANPDYKIAVDRKKSEIRPSFKLDDVGNKFVSVSNAKKTGNLVTMPFTDVKHITQPYATTTRNAAGLFYNYQGSIVLTPDSDYWADTTREPDLMITEENDLSNWQVIADMWGTEWGDWETNWATSSTSSSTSRISTAASTSTTTTTTTTTTTSQTRTGTELSVGTTTTTQNYGDRVIDVSVVPYMRSRLIEFEGYGFKPNTRLYATFDDENVSEYVQQTGKERGDPLITDENGNISGTFLLPNDDKLRFRTGTKIFRLNDNPQGFKDAGLVTTFGQTEYTASGINQIKQGTIVSTVSAQIAPVTVFDDRILTTSETSQSTVTIRNRNFGRAPGDGGNGGNRDPIAQTFVVEVPDGVPGAFFTKIDLYFGSKHPVFGVEVEIRELNSGGYLTRNVVPYSKTRLSSSQINVSEDASVPTTFNFEAPVFLMANVTYAFVVRPEANNDQTTVWVSKIGFPDVATNNLIVEQPYVGVLFASSNDSAWEPVQDEDIKFNLYRAKFTTGSGTVNFANNDEEYLKLASVTGNFTEIGEEIKGRTTATLTDITGGTIANSDILVGQTSETSGQIVKWDSPNCILANVSIGKDFEEGETCNVFDSGGTPKGVTATIGSLSTPKGVLLSYNVPDSENIFMTIGRTNSVKFAASDEIRGQISNTSAIIDSFLDKKVNLVNFQSSEIVLVGTSINWELKTTANTEILDSDFVYIQQNSDYYLPEEKLLMSKTNEINKLSSSKSLQLRSTLHTDLDYVSPVIDVSRTHTMFVHNIINNDSTGEDGNSGGNALARYISKKVTLAEGQDAEDIKVYVTGYRPVGTDIKLYVKALNANDSDIFENLNWEPLTMTSKELYSSRENKDDFKEFEYSFPLTSLTGEEGEYQYVNSEGILYTGYKYFAVKIVLLSTNSVDIPRCKDMRVICLQR